MALTYGFDAGRQQCFQQIDKLINSHSLRGSESLCKLLRYLAETSLDHHGAAVKEYQIATEVLGRSHGFDPQNDSTVRVQAGRLRVKLEEYYAHEGANDEIVVELPRKSYALTFHVRAPAAPPRQPGGDSAAGCRYGPESPNTSLQSGMAHHCVGAFGLSGGCIAVRISYANSGRLETSGSRRLPDLLAAFRGWSTAAVGDF